MSIEQVEAQERVATLVHVAEIRMRLHGHADQIHTDAPMSPEELTK